MLSLEHLADLFQQNRAAAKAQVREFSIGARQFRFNTEPAIMGVINLSPDSWYRESVCLSAEAAVRRGKILAAQGADIIDLGAESTLAHAARVDDSAQSDKLLPIVKALSAAGVLISVETYQLAVTRACFDAGARILNLTSATNNEEFFHIAAA